MSERVFPKELFLSAYSPGRHLAEVVVVTPNRPGVLASIAKVIADLRINILNSVVMAPPLEEKSVKMFFLDLTETGMSLGEVRERLLKLETVEGVYVNEPLFPGFVIDTYGFPLMAAGKRHITISVESFADVTERILGMLGTGGAFVFYEMGMSMGSKKAQRTREELGLSWRQLVEVVLAERLTDGWCIAKVVEEDEEKKIWRVAAKDLFECLPYKDKLREPRSHFFRGYLAGLFSAAYGLPEITCAEERCIATGSEKCQFVVAQRRA